ncbi:hypothetical protein CLAFUW4_10097 [Fulvia fulva]|uniref:BTB domain-containing protein n=1 Tax=Passalora fulva TaxID=5499 RepID=A0A9Q8P879_PASFU|nr:uncharacterized protein CLAFUR5_04710 [Fulvia fulva]KAK4615961.1 hypothetical protein CLAFUR4_10101 [Fulvia fulva]KAK4616467.1 hypothetical protein CLAFUR0_10099 [Fulvia fulva]UJO16920.1 hypothetical protein CLAFUR5_04710 [Fulvia fulva]WPV19277.1 hypothetical protein CLAFUW4_10097 [Fulvia fulva]WPV33901.1 hypothetical protein CLAFUW7_10098 [Fulvia fulva]
MMEQLKVAFSAYRNEDRFADFTVVYGDKKCRLHRCFIAAHSKWFERCLSGSFSKDTECVIELKDGQPEAVDRMIQYFYDFDYDGDLGNDSIAERKPYQKKAVDNVQLHAHVYEIAHKYEIPELKTLALTKFKQASAPVLTNGNQMLGAAYTVYKCIELPDHDRTLPG